MTPTKVSRPPLPPLKMESRINFGSSTAGPTVIRECLSPQ